MIQVGKQAPDIALKASNGEMVKLSDFRGQRIIIYFYPRDMTPSCTTQACEFRDNHKAFEAENTVILGISTDSETQHNKFIAKYKLPFLLLVDDKHEVAESYQVWVEKNMFGKKFMGIERSTFVIDEAGILLKEWRKVKVKDHVEEALTYIQDLSKHKNI